MSHTSTFAAVRSGILKAVPLFLGYLPISFAFGVLALGAGVSKLNTFLMSLLVYAGSSQIVAVQMLLMSATVPSIILTTFMVNLRHLLMASAMAPHLRHFSLKELMLFGSGLSDESFAMHSTRYGQGGAVPSTVETFTINTALQIAWVLGTVLAVFVQASSDSLNRFGLDYAPAAMFIALLVLLVGDWIQAATALLCGLLAVSFVLFGLGSWSIITATVIGATLGTLGEKWINKKSL